MNKHQKLPVSLIIPAFNEESQLQAVLSSVFPALYTGTLSEVIVVDDGSTDNTSRVANGCSRRHNAVTVRTLHKNSGKGNALAEGTLISRHPIVLFLDADLIDLTAQDIEHMILPLRSGRAQVVISRIKSRATPGLTHPKVSGQRTYFRSDLLPLLPELSHLGFGVEAFLSKRLSHLETQILHFPKISYVTKKEKRGHVAATLEHIRMWREVYTGMLKGKKDR
jgi:glycosyltransferase involved in cell wall biosynthesis